MSRTTDPAVTDFDTVFSALVRGFDGWPMTDGSTLTCTDQVFEDTAYPTGILPILSLQEGTWTSTVFNAWLYEVVWTIPAELFVAADYQVEGGTKIRSAIVDVMQAAMSIGGLPVDKAGKVLRYTPDTSWLADEPTDVTYLVDRGGPLLLSGAVLRDSQRPYAKVRMSLRLDFYMSVDPRQLSRVRTIKLTLTPLDPARHAVLLNLSRLGIDPAVVGVSIDQ